MKKINWGIIGLGNIAHSFSDGFFNADNSKLLAVSSRDSNKLERFKKKFDIQKNYVFNDYEEILNCADIDIIYITLPNNFHYEWIIKAINKNKRILVEKPAVLNFPDAKKIQKKILEKNLFFTEGYMYRFYPQIKKTIEIINNQEIGTPFSMETSFGSNLLSKKKFIFFNRSKKIDPNNRIQTIEVSDIIWSNLQEAQELIRPYHKEKLAIIKKSFQILKSKDKYFTEVDDCITVY